MFPLVVVVVVARDAPVVSADDEVDETDVVDALSGLGAAGVGVDETASLVVVTAVVEDTTPSTLELTVVELAALESLDRPVSPDELLAS